MVEAFDAGASVAEVAARFGMATRAADYHLRRLIGSLRRPVHGTTQGYRRHRAAGEPPCADCYGGHTASLTAYDRERRPRRTLDTSGSV